MSSFLGVDIGGTNVKLAIVLEDGSIAVSAASPWSGGPPEEAVEITRRLRGESRGAAPTPVAACGVGCAGLVDGRAGVVRTSPNLPTWHDVPLERMMGDALGLPVVLDNDANAAAYAELSVGAAKGAANAVVLTLGTGLGAGIIVDGSVYRGAHGFAGEVGHAVTARGAAAEPCGPGSLEERVSAGSIVRRAVELSAPGAGLRSPSVAAPTTARDVGELAASGDPVAAAALAATGRELAAGLWNLVAVLDPDVIVIGGGVAEAGELLLEPTRKHLASLAASCDYSVPPVVHAELGELAGVIGAALLARDRSTAQRSAP